MNFPFEVKEWATSRMEERAGYLSCLMHSESVFVIMFKVETTARSSQLLGTFGVMAAQFPSLISALRVDLYELHLGSLSETLVQGGLSKNHGRSG